MDALKKFNYHIRLIHTISNTFPPISDSQFQHLWISGLMSAEMPLKSVFPHEISVFIAICVVVLIRISITRN